ncbi:hypothetical protein MLD38_006560 [Melastoma candidum]|uniref:Uncharacterized protein n=1 Tax=Melastoma candidum TaxID=119954 RepID=A0ACB9RR97_9MYRT|nr:hypothetical protein MLD38_006560 [Melastoma candidum]
MAVENRPATSLQFVVALIIINKLLSSVGQSKQGFGTTSLPPKLSSLSIAGKLHIDPHTLNIASTDFGNMVREYPQAVFRPSSVEDIRTLVKFVHDGKEDSSPLKNLTITARGHGHSVRGQATARDGIVVEMSALSSNENARGGRVSVSVSQRKSHGNYADVGGEALWIDVLQETLKHGLTPVSWTDYLYLTVGGTLSNAGISGSTFRYGPQISNVFEMDVITGTGELATCSARRNRDLFYAVLGGLGQFGIITRARIALEPAPQRVIWARLLYCDFSAFTRDQERLIAINGRYDERALDYQEGAVLMHQGSPNNWRSSFFPASDRSRIVSLITKNDIVYCLEVAKYYDNSTKCFVDKVMEDLLQGLSYVPKFRFQKDVTYVEFLNRVRDGELKLRSQGSWEVPHPWLNLFVPKSRISDFNVRVLKDIILRNNITSGPVLIYPMNKNKWDDRMSAVIPDEDVFYTVGFLQSSGPDDWRDFDLQNEEVLRCCEESGMGAKQYLPKYDARDEWKKHFGSKLVNFQRAKAKFDPKTILSPGQRIFN